LDNRRDRDEIVDATFRVSGKAPELWHAETGATEPVSYALVNGRTTVPLHLEPWGTVFVIFRKAATAPSLTLPKSGEETVASVKGPWVVSFEPNRGAPPRITLATLSSWSDSADLGVRYFSGGATYTTAVDVPAEWSRSGSRVWIDLGSVKNLAEVTVNGQALGVVWHAPFRLDVTDSLRPGPNAFSIRVTNAWVNRMIADQQPGAAIKYTYADIAPYHANSPLLASGLLGPVRIVRVGPP
jgi:hypothetical protein